MMCGFRLLFEGGQVNITKKDTGWPRPLNRGGCIIQVSNAAFVHAKIWDFENYLLNKGQPLNTGLLYRFDCKHFFFSKCPQRLKFIMPFECYGNRDF